MIYYVPRGLSAERALEAAPYHYYNFVNFANREKFFADILHTKYLQKMQKKRKIDYFYPLN